MTIKFEEILDSGTDALYYTIDVSHCASLVSRKFFRQGLEWAIAGIRMSSEQAVKVTIATLPPTWVTANAWRASFDAWSKMNKLAMENAEDSIISRYHDFKVYFDQANYDNSHPQYAPWLLPEINLPAAIDADSDWEKSTLHFPEDSEYPDADMTIHMIGDDDPTLPLGSLSAIHGYANARARPVGELNDPNVPELGTESWLNSLFDFGEINNEIISDITLDNNSPPYPVGNDSTEQEYYPGGKNYMNTWNYWTISDTNVYNSGAGNSANGFIPGFTAQCGLIRIKIAKAIEQQFNFTMYLDLLPGEHRGYMARPMQEVN